MGESIGGQAVIEGVMMRSSKKYSIAVRKPDNDISLKVMEIDNDKWYYNVPFIRGIPRFLETITIGVKALNYSANESMGEEDNFSLKEMIITVFLSIGLTVLLFYMAPLALSKLIIKNSGFWFNIMDGVIRIIIFLLYLFFISAFSDIKRIFQYHGAEHMTVHAHEHKVKLTVKNIRKYTTLHPRCGTNFIVIVLLVSIFVFSVIPFTSFAYRLLSRLILLPIIAGVSYEVLRFAGKYYKNPIVKALVYPGIFLQKITTKDPTDDMIEVAIKAIKGVI